MYYYNNPLEEIMFRLRKSLFPLGGVIFFLLISPVKGELFSGRTVLDISQRDEFDFSSDKLNPGQDIDLSVGLDEDGNFAFLPPTVIKDMGGVSLEEVREAPNRSEYSEGTTIKKDHTYCVVTKENHYAKLFVEENAESPMKVTICWIYQSDGSRELNSKAGVISNTTWGKIKALFR